MIRIYYDPQTGEIEYSMTAKLAAPSNLPYIESEVDIKISEFIVDVKNKRLQPNPNPIQQRVGR